MARQITAQQAYMIRGGEIAKELDAYAVPLSKVKDVVTHYGLLLARHPKMTNGRIVRKTVEYFKLQKKEVA